MKQITEAALEHVMLACPNTRIEHRDGKRIAVIPFYNFDTDEAGVLEKEVVPGPQETPMGILPVFNVRTGPMGILPVFNVRTGPKFNPDGDARQSPLGKFYRVIGYSPGPKKDDR